MSKPVKWPEETMSKPSGATVRSVPFFLEFESPGYLLPDSIF